MELILIMAERIPLANRVNRKPAILMQPVPVVVTTGDNEGVAGWRTRAAYGETCPLRRTGLPAGKVNDPTGRCRPPRNTKDYPTDPSKTFGIRMETYDSIPNAANL
jgi:hypothetical protein